MQRDRSRRTRNKKVLCRIQDSTCAPCATTAPNASMTACHIHPGHLVFLFVCSRASRSGFSCTLNHQQAVFPRQNPPHVAHRLRFSVDSGKFHCVPLGFGHLPLRCIPLHQGDSGYTGVDTQAKQKPTVFLFKPTYRSGHPRNELCLIIRNNICRIEVSKKTLYLISEQYCCAPAGPVDKCLKHYVSSISHVIW